MKSNYIIFPNDFDFNEDDLEFTPERDENESDYNTCPICGVEHFGMDLGPGMNCFDYAEDDEDVRRIEEKLEAIKRDSTERE